MTIVSRTFSQLLTCVTLVLALGSCGGGGGSDGGGTSIPPGGGAGTVTITGTVSGTIIKVLRADTGAVITSTDTAALVTPPFSFALSGIPVGVPVKVFFFSAGETFPLYVGNSSTNVFTVLTAGPIDLGFVQMLGGRATPTNPLPTASTTLVFPPNPSLPSGVEPLPATLTVSTPAPATGSIIVDFAVQNFVIGGQGQPHLHIQVDGGSTRHFFNGQTNNVLNDSSLPTTDVVHQSLTSFRINGLSVGQHQVTVTLATASHNEFSNQEANPPVVTVTINSPPVPSPTLTITGPSQGASLPSGPVGVSFTVQNFTIGGQSSPHLHIYVDGGNANHFFNGTTNQVLDGNNGQPVANIVRQDNTSFQINGLSSGPHTIRLRLADPVDQELQNAEAKPPDLNFSIQASAGNATLTIDSPTQGASLSPGPVLITFDIQNSPVTTPALPRMHFYVDNNNSVMYEFFAGSGITEDGATSGVRYQGVHTHFVHWKSNSSIQLNALASGSHQVRFVLVDQTGAELASTGKTLDFILLQGTGGNFFLEEVVDGLNFPTAMATAPDGTVFVTEKETGNIRVVTPKPQPQQWDLQTAPFAHLDVQTGNEQGLLGIAVDPDFNTNHFVYVFYTAAATTNRIGRFTATTSTNGTVAQSGTPTQIFVDMPSGVNHNGGVIRFGPDGMLYIFLGENEVDRTEAQNLGSLKGKILRINKSGSIPSDNPFPSSAIYSYGHRNSFGFTFHPHTNDLWETENGENLYDQINRIVPGGNYGWPIVEGESSDPRYINPALIFTGYSPPTIAPTGIIAIGENSIYPAQYRNNLLVADFNNGWLHQLTLTGNLFDTIGSETVVCQCGKGGLLSVMQGVNVPGQDGYIYVTNGDYLTSNHSIFRVRFNP